jgi:hypothetical protein
MALDQEASRRRLQLEGVKQTRAADEAADLARETQQQELDERKRLKEYRRYKWGMTIVSPVVAIWFLFEPPKLVDLRGPKGLIVATILFWWVAEFVRWRRSINSVVASDA